MSKKKTDSVKQQRDPDLVNAEVAMKRAAIRDRELAQKTGIAVVILKDEVIQEECAS